MLVHLLFENIVIIDILISMTLCIYFRKNFRRFVDIRSQYVHNHSSSQTQIVNNNNNLDYHNNKNNNNDQSSSSLVATTGSEIKVGVQPCMQPPKKRYMMSNGHCNKDDSNAQDSSRGSSDEGSGTPAMFVDEKSTATGDRSAEDDGKSDIDENGTRGSLPVEGKFPSSFEAPNYENVEDNQLQSNCPAGMSLN